MNKRTVGLKHTSWSIMHVTCLKQLLEKTILHWAVVKAHPKHFCLFFKNVNYSMKFKWNINLNTPRSWLQRMKHQTKKVKKTQTNTHPNSYNSVTTAGLSEDTQPGLHPVYQWPSASSHSWLTKALCVCYAFIADTLLLAIDPFTTKELQSIIPFPLLFFVFSFLLQLPSVVRLFAFALLAFSAFLLTVFHTGVLLFSPFRGFVTLWQLKRKKLKSNLIIHWYDSIDYRQKTTK